MKSFNFSLNERKVQALGEEFTIRDLTIGETLEINNSKADENEMLFLMLEKAIVSPKVTLKQLLGLPSSKMGEVTTLFNAITKA